MCAPTPNSLQNNYKRSFKNSFLTVLFAFAVLAVCKEPVASGNAIKKTSVIVVSDTNTGGVRTSSTSNTTRTVFSTRRVNAAQIAKMKSCQNVLAVLPDIVPEPIKTPPMNPFAVTQTWFAQDVHRTREAWAMGYTGEGVVIAIADSGIDFGHPDLQGVQARYENPNSPYFGWPIAFDPYAMYMRASTGRYTGGYINTSTTATGDTVNFNGRVHTLTGTSKSGIYHLGKHPHYNLMWTNPWGKQPSVLVVDENEPGIYDTVYVDINKNADFRDDKPCRKGDEISWWDADGDGLADWSAGMLYFIADGENPIPGSDWLYGIPPPANGSMVAFTGAFDKYEDHGTLCASAAVGQGVINMGAPSWKPIDSDGMVKGSAPNAKIAAIGSIYKNGQAIYDALLFCIYGADGIAESGDEPHIVSMSFGYSSLHADGWDFLSRYLGELSFKSPKTLFIASAGNGGPGYGTLISPASSPFALAVAASTVYGSTDMFGPLAHAGQITYGQIEPWSARGPNALGQAKPDFCATGAYAAGDIPLLGNGAGAWTVWGGTSLSAPLAAGIAALVYQAYKETHGSFPDWRTARSILKSSCSDLNQEPMAQGAGTLDAAKAVMAASGKGGFSVFPDSWNAGNYRGTVYEAFPAITEAGKTYKQDFTLMNHSPVPMELRLEAVTANLVRKNQIKIQVIAEKENQFDFFRPDYLVDPIGLIDPTADMVRIRISWPFSFFAPGDPSDSSVLPENQFTLLAYQWHDLNGDGSFWKDNAPRNGLVDSGEIDENELSRIVFSANVSNYQEITINRRYLKEPHRLVIGIQHRARSLFTTTDEITVWFESYKWVRWDNVQLSAGKLLLPPYGRAVFEAKIWHPYGMPPGFKSGFIRIRSNHREEPTLIPTAVNIVSPIPFNGPNPRIVDGPGGDISPSPNGSVFGGFDWSWRPEAGDWRFFFIDISDNSIKGGEPMMLANASWRNIPTDLDLFIQMPDKNDPFSRARPEIYGPSGIELSSGSIDTSTGTGRYSFQTASGSNAEWISGRVLPGLQLLQLHAVLHSGVTPMEAYSLQAGKLWTNPEMLVIPEGYSGIPSATVLSNLTMDGVVAKAYGFAKPLQMKNQSIRQDVADNPSTASWKYDFKINDAGLLRISTKSPASIDIDLYLLKDINRDGAFNWENEVIAISGGITADESVEIRAPEPGNYRIAVHGYRVFPSASFFDLDFLLVEGNLAVKSVPIKNSLLKKAQVSIELPKTKEAGQEGVLLIGPSAAPAAAFVPIRVTK